MRKSKIERTTNETRISLEINLDGTGKYDIDCEVGFLRHMLELFSKHSLIDLKIKAKGEPWTDEHHLVEDIGICLGKALKDAVGNKKGINRYGFFLLPMDETLAQVALDLSGRRNFRLDAEFKREKVGDLSTELVYDFFKAVSDNAEMNLNMRIIEGKNEHHKIEAIFKGFAKALRMAVEFDSRVKGIPSTKGKL